MKLPVNIFRRLACLVFGCALLVGCNEEVENGYGQRAGINAGKSVNGTSVFADMFRHEGHNIYSARTLSPRVAERADCIVWFPDDYETPSEDVREWLEQWLYETPGRTLIYVARDYDAAVDYWTRMKTGASATQKPLVQTQVLEEKNRVQQRRLGLPASEDCEWFVVTRGAKPREVRTLQGDSDWTEGIDPAKLEIELNARIELSPMSTADVVLQSEGDALVLRDEWEDSQLIVVANGSFLLNLPLINHEHRKLAGKLIDEVGPAAKNVVFVESGSGGPPIRETDPAPQMPTGLAIFNLWPTNWILFHLAIVGILFCFVRMPIFGRPRQLPLVTTSDFGQHIDAMATLLKRGGDRAYAMTRLLHYQQTTRD